MNKKIAIIITLMITSTTALMGCNSTVKVDSESVPDTVFEVSSAEDDTDSSASLEQSDVNKTETTASSDSNIKTENKTTQNNTSGQTSSNKSSAKTISSTESSAKVTESTITKATSGKATTFKAQAGYTLTFPANWEGKYIVEEKPDILNVRYKCSKDKSSPNPLLFSIELDNPGKEYDHLDTVGNIRFFNVGDNKYCVGGPTGLGLGEESKDFEEYIEMSRQRAEVVNSLKVIR